MPVYVLLMNWTDQGVRADRDTVGRREHADALAEKYGARIAHAYWTMGHYDIVAVIEAPDDEAITAMVGARANLRRQRENGDPAGLRPRPDAGDRPENRLGDREIHIKTKAPGPNEGGVRRTRCDRLVHAQALRRHLMSYMLTAEDLIQHLDEMGDEELDRLQAAIDRRRKQLANEEGLPAAGASSTVVERRAYGSGVLQLEKRGESGPYWYFHLRKDGKQKTIYLGKTDVPEIKLAQIKGGIGG